MSSTVLPRSIDGAGTDVTTGAIALGDAVVGAPEAAAGAEAPAKQNTG